MKLLFDLHTHTIASGHAFGTLKENIEEAAAKGLKILGTSDHAVNMPGTTNPIFFTNYRAIPEEVLGVKILKGIEANIMDYEGKIDVEEKLYPVLDYVIASLHVPCIKSGTVEENTNALIGAMKNPYVKIIGHPDDSRYSLDYDRLTDAAKEHEVVLELNNASFGPASGRQNAYENDQILLEHCKKKKVPIILGSDAHIFCDVGRFEGCMKMLELCDFPKELIINHKKRGLLKVLNKVPEWLQ